MVDNHCFGGSSAASSLYNYFKKGATCAEKRENDAENERKRMAHEKRKCYVLK